MMEENSKNLRVQLSGLNKTIDDQREKIKELELLNDNLSEQLILACDTITQQAYRYDKVREMLID